MTGSLCNKLDALSTAKASWNTYLSTDWVSFVSIREVPSQPSLNGSPCLNPSPSALLTLALSETPPRPRLLPHLSSPTDAI